MSERTQHNTNDIYLYLGRLEGKIDAIITSNANLYKTNAAQEERLKLLELRNAKQNGMIAAITLIAGAAGSAIAFLGQFIFGKV